MTYQGISFILADCRDWSAVQLVNPPRSRWPWPYPEANLLGTGTSTVADSTMAAHGGDKRAGQPYELGPISI